MASAKKKSPLWEYFDINSENNKLAVCLLCNVNISRGGEGKKAGTSAMKNHLKSKHPDEFRAVNKEKAAVEPTTISLAIAGTSSSSFAKKQLTMTESFERKLLWDINDAKAKKYHYLVAEMIALDNEPLSIVERTGFTRLLEQALPGYKLPSRTYISQKIVPDIYDRIYEKIKLNISSAFAISVTSDIWTCLHNNDSFLSFTAHWISSEFKLEHGVLAMKPFSGSHTKIHLLIHDSGANMVKGVRLAKYDSARCFIHTLQRAINESLKVQTEVTAMIAAGRRLVTHFNHSGLAQEKLLTIQKELSLPEHQLVQDISTRWNSTFYLIERLLEQKRAISLYVADHDTFVNLTAQQWSLMEQCINLLKPFEEITKITSSGLSCVLEVIPHVTALKKYLDKAETEQRTPDLSHMRASLKAELEVRFNSISQDLNYLIATYLDPRFKTNYLGVIDAERARQEILLEYLKMSCEESSSSSSCSTPAKKSRGEETESAVSRKAHDTFWDCFDEVANENNTGQVQREERNALTLQYEY
nr:zinc finger BED domain-containing protein 4-like [Plodia interpunctella]